MSPALPRVLWIIDYFPRPGDISHGTWALESAAALAKRGAPVNVLVPTPWIPTWAGITRKLKGVSEVPAAWRIRGVEVRYAKCPHYPHRYVRHTAYRHFPYFECGFLWPWILRALESLEPRDQFEVVHANFVFPSGFIGLQIKKRFGTPFLIQERSERRLMAAMRYRRQRELYRDVVTAADAVITLNSKMADGIREIAPDVGSIDIVRASADPASAPTEGASRPREYQGCGVVLSVGALIERKGHEVLIRAFSRVARVDRNARCIIVGDGPRLRRLRRLVSRLGLESAVQIRGHLPHHEVLRMMSWCDVFALPSWDEASGTVYSEAMAQGRPIIACQGEGITEVVRDGVHGLLVPPRNEAALATAMSDLLGQPELASRMGQSGRELAESELGYDHLSDRFLAMYDRVLRAGQR